MKKLLIKDARGELLAFIGTREEFELQQDAARVLGSTEWDILAWIDWVESTAPGNGTLLLEEALLRIEADGVKLIGLEVVPKDPDRLDDAVRFYRKFGFVDVSAIAPYADFPIMFRDAGWNGIE
jgi:GNAT superfamily N-acetyltransferase